MSKEIRKQCFIPMHIVAKKPERYVEEGAVDACKKLWNLNIFTAGSDGFNDKQAYIELEPEQLSKENKLIFDEKLMQETNKKSSDKHYFKFKSTWAIGCIGSGEVPLDLLESFTMQDVMQGVMSKEEFLRDYCDCYYYYEPGVKAFSKERMTKSFSEYLADETGELKQKQISPVYVEDENKVYLDQYYLDRHNAYLEHCQGQNPPE